MKQKIRIYVPVDIEFDVSRDVLFNEILPDLKTSGSRCWAGDYRWEIRTDKIARKQVLDALVKGE